MKRLLATTALLAVLTTPVMADVTIGGDMEWSYQDNDGTTSSAMDGDINFVAKTTTDTGFTFGADFNINHNGDDDGEDEVIDFETIINEVALLRNRWLGIMKGLDTKQWQMGHVVRLRTAGMEDIRID